MALLRNLLLLIFCSSSLFPGGIEVAKDVFRNNLTVKAAIKEALDNDLLVADDINAIFLFGSCGTIGCIETYLVSIRVQPKEEVLNPPSSSIMARIILKDQVFWSLTLVDSSKANRW